MSVLFIVWPGGGPKVEDCTEVYHLSWCWRSCGKGSVFLLAFDLKLSINLAKTIGNSHQVMHYYQTYYLHVQWCCTVVLCWGTQSQKSAISCIMVKLCLSNVERPTWSKLCMANGVHCKVLRSTALSTLEILYRLLQGTFA